MYNISILTDGCNELGISLSHEQQDKFIRYYQMIIEKNKVMNLTAITDWEEVQTKHFLDSLLVCKAADMSGNLSILDLGTGAGFPGIPLKIAFPHLNIILVDSLNKRIRFLDEVIKETGLTGISTVHARAEDIGRQTQYREASDIVVSRAVANLSSLCEYCLPLVKTGGMFISYKSAEIEDELTRAGNSVRILGGDTPAVCTLTLPGTDIVRKFVKIKKKNTTSAKYPRKAGIPLRDPL